MLKRHVHSELMMAQSELKHVGGSLFQKEKLRHLKTVFYQNFSE